MSLLFAAIKCAADDSETQLGETMTRAQSSERLKSDSSSLENPFAEFPQTAEPSATLDSSKLELESDMKATTPEELSQRSSNPENQAAIENLKLAKEEELKGGRSVQVLESILHRFINRVDLIDLFNSSELESLKRSIPIGTVCLLLEKCERFERRRIHEGKQDEKIMVLGEEKTLKEFMDNALTKIFEMLDLTALESRVNDPVSISVRAGLFIFELIERDGEIDWPIRDAVLSIVDPRDHEFAFEKAHDIFKVSNLAFRTRVGNARVNELSEWIAMVINPGSAAEDNRRSKLGNSFQKIYNSCEQDPMHVDSHEFGVNSNASLVEQVNALEALLRHCLFEVMPLTAQEEINKSALSLTPRAQRFLDSDAFLRMLGQWVHFLVDSKEIHDEIQKKTGKTYQQVQEQPDSPLKKLFVAALHARREYDQRDLDILGTAQQLNKWIATVNVCDSHQLVLRTEDVIKHFLKQGSDWRKLIGILVDYRLVHVLTTLLEVEQIVISNQNYRWVFRGDFGRIIPKKSNDPIFTTLYNLYRSWLKHVETLPRTKIPKEEDMKEKIVYSIRDTLAAILKERGLEELSVDIAFSGTSPNDVKTFPVGPKNRETHISELIIRIAENKELLKMAFVHPFFIFHLSLFISNDLIERSLGQLLEEMRIIQEGGYCTYLTAAPLMRFVNYEKVVDSVLATPTKNYNRSMFVTFEKIWAVLKERRILTDFSLMLIELVVKRQKNNQASDISGTPQERLHKLEQQLNPNTYPRLPRTFDTLLNHLTEEMISELKKYDLWQNSEDFPYKNIRCILFFGPNNPELAAIADLLLKEQARR